MRQGTEQRPEQRPEPAGEWLELGRKPFRLRQWRWRRPALIGLAAVVIIAAIAIGVVVVRPVWVAQQTSLTPDQVRAALDRLDLADRRLRSTSVEPETSSGADVCGVLRGLVDVDGPDGLPSVEVTGRVPGDTARVTVSGVVFPTPAAAADQLAEIEGALRNPVCLDSWELGRLAVDPWPQPDRRLGYLIGLPVSGTGSGDTWWYRARVLRFGNTVSYLSSFGPTGAADVTTGLAEALDRAYADLA